jgi:hypothetical protein
LREHLDELRPLGDQPPNGVAVSNLRHGCSVRHVRVQTSSPEHLDELRNARRSRDTIG